MVIASLTFWRTCPSHPRGDSRAPSRGCSPQRAVSRSMARRCLGFRRRTPGAGGMSVRSDTVMHAPAARNSHDRSACTGVSRYPGTPRRCCCWRIRHAQPTCLRLFISLSPALCFLVSLRFGISSPNSTLMIDDDQHYHCELHLNDAFIGGLVAGQTADGRGNEGGLRCDRAPAPARPQPVGRLRTIRLRGAGDANKPKLGNRSAAAAPAERQRVLRRTPSAA
jgi:hypothetical protein